jgi:organic hydroperoxide reductase OsmC/OhrA
MATSLCWRDSQIQKPQTAKVDTAKQDAGEALFIKFAEVKLDTALPDISDAMSDELIKKIKDMVD